MKFNQNAIAANVTFNNDERKNLGGIVADTNLYHTYGFKAVPSSTTGATALYALEESGGSKTGYATVTNKDVAAPAAAKKLWKKAVAALDIELTGTIPQIPALLSYNTTTYKFAASAEYKGLKTFKFLYTAMPTGFDITKCKFYYNIGSTDVEITGATITRQDTNDGKMLLVVKLNNALEITGTSAITDVKLAIKHGAAGSEAAMTNIEDVYAYAVDKAVEGTKAYATVSTGKIGVIL